MVPKFIQPAFIRRNAPDLRKKLEELGYMECYCYKAEPILATTTTDLLPSNVPDVLVPIYTSTHREIPNYVEKGFIDCGENEQLFLALAALREDSDYMQWFVHKSGAHWDKVTDKEMTFAEDFNASNEDANLRAEDYHKATPEELIEHFKEK